MYQEKVLIKQLVDDYNDSLGLSKYNRSRMPKCVERLVAAPNRDGRFITGIDEQSLEIHTIQNSEARLEKEKEVKALRESLERQTGYDLSATSDFWTTFSVDISSDADLTLNKSNPKDVIRYHLLIANNYVAPSKEEAGHPRYANAKYFAFTTEVENQDRVSTRKLKDKAKAALTKIEKKPETMALIGQYLEGNKYSNKLEPDVLYMMLSDFIEADKKGENVNKFLSVIEKDIVELQFKVTIDKAIRSKIIKFRDKYYQRGQVTLGKTVDEVYNTLQSPEFAAEFESIANELKK